MSAKKIVLALALSISMLVADAAIAGTPKPGEIVGAIAFLLRVKDGVCPGITFDPVTMSRMLDRRGMSVAEIQKKYPKIFSESYDQASSRISVEGMSAYCNLVRSFFGRTPGEFPGLVVQ